MSIVDANDSTGDLSPLPERDQETPAYVSEFDRLQAQLQESFARLGTQFDHWRSSLGFDGSFTPAADVEETDEAFLVEIELAGVKRGDIDVTTSGRRLTVTGERKAKESVGVLRRRSRVVGRFRYEVMLPGDFDADGVSAGLEDGVLTVRLPKLDTERPRRVAIS